MKTNLPDGSLIKSTVKKKKNKRGEKEFKGSLICLKGSMSFGADTVSNVEKVRKAAVAGRFKCD